MAVIEARDDNFDELIENGVSIIDFYSTHCGPCRALLPMLLEVEGDLPFINLIKVNTDFCPELTDRFQIMSLPTLYLAKDGKTRFFDDTRDEDGLKQAIGEMLYE